MTDKSDPPTPVNDSTAAEVLWNATERLRALEEAAPVGVVALDDNGRVMIWNAAAERLFGWRAGSNRPALFARAR